MDGERQALMEKEREISMDGGKEREGRRESLRKRIIHGTGVNV